MSKSLKLSLAMIVAAAVTLVIALVATNDGDPDTEPTTGNAGLLHEQVTGWVTQPEWLAWS